MAGETSGAFFTANATVDKTAANTLYLKYGLTK